MKRLLFALFLTLFISSSANANAFSEYVSNLIPGEGDTEVSIDLRENHSPDYSILLVRELDKTDDGNYFTQLSLSLIHI